MAVKEPTGDLKKACWKGYTAVGMKNKNGRKVPNCVPVKEESNEPKDREEGTTKLAKRYKKDTPGQCDCTQKEEFDQMDEAHKLNSPVEIIKGPRKGIKGHVGEIRQSYKGGPKTYTVYHGDHGATQVSKEDIRAMKEETTGVQKHIVAVTLSDPSVKSADKIFKKIAVRASDKDEAKKRAIKFYRKAGYKVHDAYHHSVVTVLNKEEVEQQVNEVLDTISKRNTYLDAALTDAEKQASKTRTFRDAPSTARDKASRKLAARNAGVKRVTKKIMTREEAEQMDEVSYTGKGNHKPGWMLRADPALAAKFKEIEKKRALRKKYMGKTSDEIEKMKKEEVEQMDEASYDSLTLRSLSSTDPKKQPDYAYKTQKGKVAAAKKNVPDLKAAIKSSLGKHPKPNLPEEVEQMDEKHLTPAERKKREEIAQAMERKNPGMDMGKKMAIATAQAKKVAEGYGPKRYGSREHDWGDGPEPNSDKKFPYSGQNKSSWAHVHVNGEKVKEFHGPTSYDDASEHAHELAYQHKKAGQKHKIEIRDHSQPNTMIRVNETRNIIREVIKKKVDDQGTNQAKGKTATGEPMPKVQIDPVIDLGPTRG
jgi:hypothetical protein